ncbi:MAG: LamG-like jellyroll fold domain-containing protein, partial [Planctomycetota bacterium]
MTAIIYCEKCGKIIPPSEIDRGKAMVFEHAGICPDCAASLSPAERKEITRKLSGPPASAPGTGRAKTATARKPRAPQRTEGAPARRLAGRPSHTGITVAVIAAAALAGLAVALMGGFGSRDEPAKTPGGRPGAGAGGGRPSAGPGDVPGAGAASARKRLDEIKSMIDPSLGRYTEARAALLEFADAFDDPPCSTEAKELLDKIDADFGAMADDALEKAAKSAEALSDGKPAEARKALDEFRERFAGSEWFEERGEKAIAGALGKIDAARSEAAKAALARAIKALESERLDEVPGLLQPRAAWPEELRARADALLKKIGEAKAKLEAEQKAKDAWAAFLLGFIDAGKLGLGEAKAFLVREREALGKLGADKDIARKLERMERRFREVGLVEELAEVGLRGSRGTIYFVWKGERIGGKIRQVEKGVVSLVTTRGKQASVPIAEIAGADVVRFSRAMQQGSSGKVRAAAYLLLRGDPAAARKASKDAMGDAAWELGDQIDEFVQAVEARRVAAVKAEEAARAAAEAKAAAEAEAARKKRAEERRKSGLAAHWRLDEPASAATAADAVGAYPGRNSKPASMAGAPGRSGGAYRFAREVIKTSMRSPHDADMTWAAWIRTSARGAIIGNSADVWCPGGRCLFVAGDRTLKLNVGWVSYFGTGAAVADGSWHHVALTVVNSGGAHDTVKMYVDGVRKFSRDLDFYKHNGAHLKMQIGHIPNDAGYFKGAIDDVRVYTRALSAAEIRSFVEGPATAAKAGKKPERRGVARGLVGHWKLDDGKGATAKDSSGKGNDGAVKGRAKWVAGKRGGALYLDGNTAHVSIPKQDPFRISGSITVAAWIKAPPFTRDFQAIVTKGDDSWRLHRSGNSRFAEWTCTGLKRGGWLDVPGTTVVDDNRWHHLAGVYDGTTSYLYVDGKMEASKDAKGSIKLTNHRVRIGDNAQRKGRGFRGTVDDVRVYKRALTASGIRSLAAD